MIIPRHFENLHVLHENTLPERSYFIPASRKMEDLVEQGKSIIMISSELAEVLRMSDRILVMCEGRKTGELDIAEATQENIMQLATMREEN